MNTNLQKIGELLAQCRKNKGLTQEEVGVMIGVQKAMVSKVENGLCVNFGTVNRIAEALGVEPIVALKSKKKADKNLIDYVMTGHCRICAPSRFDNPGGKQLYQTFQRH